VIPLVGSLLRDDLLSPEARQPACHLQTTTLWESVSLETARMQGVAVHLGSIC
jgi:hypothetical protein